MWRGLYIVYAVLVISVVTVMAYRDEYANPSSSSYRGSGSGGSVGGYGSGGGHK